MLASKIDKIVDFKNVAFKDRLDSESQKIYNEIKEPNEKIDYTKLVSIGSGKQRNYNFTIFLGLESFAENIYNGIL